jgi:hypothetical protein
MLYGDIERRRWYKLGRPPDCDRPLVPNVARGGGVVDRLPA